MPGVTFPAFIKLEHQRDNSAKSSFLAAVDDTLGAAESRFREFSGEAQRLVDSALSIKRNDAGSLDLGVPQLQAAAKAQQARAIAAREVAAATALAAKEIGDESRQTRLAIAATEALAIEEERAAAAARAHAAAAEQVQERLNRQKSATDAVVAATSRGTNAYGAVTNSVRAHRVAMVQLGQQMQDMIVQAQGGTSALVIFTQQVPQMAFALSGLPGKVGAVARALAGPLGASIILVTALLGPFILKLFESEKNLADLVKKLGEDAQSARESSEAHRLFSQTLEGQIQLQQKLTEELDKSIKSQRQLNEEKLRSDQANKAALEADVSQAQAELEKARANKVRATDAVKNVSLAAAPGTIEGLIAAETRADQILRNAQDQLIRAQSSLGAAVRNIRSAQVPLIQDEVSAALDSKAGAVRALTIELDKLTESWLGGGTAEDAYRSKSAAIKKQIEDLTSTAAKGARELAQFGSPIPGAGISSGYGHRVRPTAGASTDHLGIDYKASFGTPVLAAMDGIVKFANMVNGYGNQIELNHGAGTASRYSHLSRFNVTEGQQVAKGDTIGYVGKTGIATGPHLHYEVLLNGKKVDPTKGPFPIDATKVAENGERARAAAQRVAEQLQNFGERSAESIARVNERFNEQPRLIDAAAQATRQLDQIIKDLGERKPAGFQQMITDAQAAKLVIEDALVRPFRELERDSKRRIETNNLLARGREAEANALQTIWNLERQIGPLTDDRKNQIYEIAKAEEQANEALKHRQELTNAYLDATRSIRSELESFFSGDGADFGKIFKRLQAKILVENLFGDSLRSLEKTIKTDGLQTSVDSLATQTDRGATELASFADAVRNVTEQISTVTVGARAGDIGAPIPGAAIGLGAGASGSLESAFDSVFADRIARSVDSALADAANDIVVIGRKPANDNKLEIPPGTATTLSLTPSSYADLVTNAITKPLAEVLDNLLGTQFFSQISGALSGALQGLATGGATGGIFGLLKGIEGLPKSLSKVFDAGLQGSQTGTLVAGIAQSLGIKNFSTTGSQIGGALGQIVGGPIGSIIGSTIGGLIGKLFHKAKWGNAVVSNSGITGSSNQSEAGSAAGKAGDSVGQAISKIVETLGGKVGQYLVSIGVTDGKWRYSTTGRTGELKSKYSDVHLTGEGEEGYKAAVAGAIADAIADGAIQGIRETTQRILRMGGSDIDAALQKAVDFESVFKALKKWKDPVGAALDELDVQFNKLKTIFDEAGASTAEYAQLEELYGLERSKAVKAAMEQIAGSLKSLYEDLTIGDSGLSLRDRKAAALAKYTPLAAKVAAGDVTAYDDFAEAARALLEIERQRSGSQGDYFSLLAEVTTLSKTQLDKQTALANASAGRDSPFSSTTPTSANDNGATVDAITGLNSMTFGQLSAVNQNLGIMIRQMAASGQLALGPSAQGFW